MLIHHPADGVFERAWHNLILQRDWEHDQLIFIEWFEFCHRVLYGYRTLEILERFAPLFRQFQRLALPGKGGIWREKPPDAESASWGRFPESAGIRPHLSGAPSQDGGHHFCRKKPPSRAA
jgi:hypothetical protein